MLGRDLVPLLGDYDVLALTRRDADLADETAFDRRLADYRADVVFHTAAYTDVDGCELDPERARRDNVVATAHVARRAALWNATLVHVSTDYVFDGTQTSPIRPDTRTHPLSIYGETKLAAEQAVQAAGGRSLIVRTAWLVGTHGKNFVEAVRERARRGESLRVVNDQRGSPTFTFDLAVALLGLVERGALGVLHVTNQGECTRYQQAVEIVRQEGLPAQIVPVTSAEMPRPARRPAYSVLDNSAAIAILGAPLPPWTESLARYLRMKPAPVA